MVMQLNQDESQIINVSLCGMFASLSRTRKVQLQVAAITLLGDIVRQLDSSSIPGLLQHCTNDFGGIKDGIHILLDGKVADKGYNTPVKAGSTITFMTAICGG
jgi:molybdopterin converting factor small subunit